MMPRPSQQVDWQPITEAQDVKAAAAADIRGEIIAILTNKEFSHAKQRTLIAETVVRALLQRGQLFFHAGRRDFDSAMVFDRSRKRLERIRSDSFQAWLSDWLGINRADVIFRYVTAELETRVAD